jgi:ABC-type bacteriocin/lantibiotic exporter with double-glycine peptidase domain
MMNDHRRSEHKQSFFDLSAWRYFGSFYQGKFPAIALSSIASIVQAILILPTILLIRFVFNVAIPEHDISRLIKIGLVIIGLNLFSAGISIWVKHLNIKTIHAVIFRLRNDLLVKLYGYSRNFYTNEDLKIVHTRIVQDTERLSNLSNALISKLLPGLFLSATLCVVLVFLNWLLFLVLFLLFPVLFFFHRYMGQQVQKKVYVFQRAFETFSRGMSFTLQFMDLIRIQTAEQGEIKKQRENIGILAATSSKMHLFYALDSQMHTFITGTSAIVIIILGGAAIAQKAMTIGDLFAFYLATGYLYRHVAMITDSFMQIVAGNASMVTLRKLATGHQQQPEFGSRKINFTGNINLRSVSFQYGSNPILRNVELQITPGCKMAIIGDNGSGKTTLINLILGFYAPTSGSVEADGIPYEELDIHHLRKYFGVVTQNPPLFSGTVGENIAIGAERTSTEEIIEISNYSQAHEFIASLPDGYDTPIGEEGSQLSGGQRQKVAIARALLRRPRLLILDEPSNHLDHASVKKLMDGLNGMPDCPALLIVSHDMSIVNQADVILELENGKLSTLTN